RQRWPPCADSAPPRPVVGSRGRPAWPSRRPSGEPPGWGASARPTRRTRELAVPSPVITLSPTRLARDLGERDLTDPDQGRHAIQLLVDAAVAGLAAAWGCCQ